MVTNPGKSLLESSWPICREGLRWTSVLLKVAEANASEDKKWQSGVCFQERVMAVT